MADKEYIRAPYIVDSQILPQSVRDWFSQVSTKVNNILTILNDREYVDNAAAVAAGLSTGDVYYNTTSSTYTKVT